LAPFNNFNEIKRSLPAFIQNDLGPYVPTGEELHASGFEQRLFNFDNALREEGQLRNAANRMPAGQVTPDWMDAQRERMYNERIRRATPEVLRAMGLDPSSLPPQPGGGERAPTVPIQPPAAAAPPPLVSYGHSVYAP
jgi:hypothetical protein